MRIGSESSAHPGISVIRDPASRTPAHPTSRKGSPHGPCAAFRAAGGQRYAVYELVRLEAAGHFNGRIEEP